MKSIDFSKPGGFPLTQDSLDYLQTAYHEALSALGRAHGDTPVILSGMATSGGPTYTIVATGFLYYNGEIIRFAGGTIPNLFGLGLNDYVVITTPATPLTYNDGSTPNVVVERVATIQRLVDTTPVDADHFSYYDLLPYGTALGRNSRESVYTTLPLFTAAGNGSVSGSLNFKKDGIANTLIFYGNLIVGSPGDFIASLPTMTGKRVSIIPSGGYRPAHEQYIRLHVADADNSVKDAAGGFQTSLSGYILSNGQFWVDFPATDVSVATYTLKFSGVICLD